MQSAEQSSVTFKGVVTHKITPKEPELDTWFIKTIEFFQQWHLFTRICNSLVQRETDVFLRASLYSGPLFSTWSGNSCSEHNYL